MTTFLLYQAGAPECAEILALVAWVQRRDHHVYLSHKKWRETGG